MTRTEQQQQQIHIPMTPPNPQPRAPEAAPNPRCTNCALRELLPPGGFNETDLGRLESLVTMRINVPKGAALFRTGETFDAVYAIRMGFFKTRVVLEDGREHVTGFLMAGEFLGLDGFGADVHACDAVALEDSQVCVIPRTALERLSRELRGVQRQFHRVMGREIVRDHGVMIILGSRRGEERLAAFLLNLAERLEARGFSSTSMLLRMTREEIGTYLGLTLETVSRYFSKFQEDGLLTVQHRRIEILDKAALSAVVDGGACSSGTGRPLRP